MARGSAAKRRVTPQPGRPDGRPRRPVFACAPPSAQAPSRSAWPSPTRPHARGPPSRAHASPEWAARSRPPRSIAPISRPPSEQPGLGGRPTARRDHNRARGPGHRPRQADGRPAAKLSLPSPMRAGPTRATLSIGIATKSSPAHCPCGRARATRHRPPGSAGCDRPRGRPGLLQLMPVRAGADENQGCKSGSMTRPIPRPRKRIEASAMRVF